MLIINFMELWPVMQRHVEASRFEPTTRYLQRQAHRQVLVVGGRGRRTNRGQIERKTRRRQMTVNGKVGAMKLVTSLVQVIITQSCGLR